METKLAIAEQKDKHTGKLPATVNMAIGMKAMVLLNVATEADIANGTRGVIHDIILDQREEVSEPDEEGKIQLKYPSAMILLVFESPVQSGFLASGPKTGTRTGPA
jgi:hypothetical protein